MAKKHRINAHKFSLFKETQKILQQKRQNTRNEKNYYYYNNNYV